MGTRLVPIITAANTTGAGLKRSESCIPQLSSQNKRKRAWIASIISFQGMDG